MRVLLILMLMCGMATAGEDYIQPRQSPDWALQMTPEQRRQESLNYANQQWKNSMAAREQQKKEQQEWQEKLDQAERELYRIQEERQSRLREANARATEEMIADMQRQQQEKALALEEQIRRRAEYEEEFKRLKEKQDAERQSLQERIAAAEQTQQYAEAQIIAERMAHDAQRRLADSEKQTVRPSTSDQLPILTDPISRSNAFIEKLTKNGIVRKIDEELYTAWVNDSAWGLMNRDMKEDCVIGIAIHFSIVNGMNSSIATIKSYRNDEVLADTSILSGVTIYR